jgi:enoyl-CoA hydratase
VTDSADLVLLDVSDRIATLTLNRPTARNALSSGLLARLREQMAAAEADSDADVVILTGADPAFCAGLDLKELGSTGGNLGRRPDGDAPAAPAGGAGVNAPWAPITKPLIGAVNGVAVTGGFELALLCDFLVASERASFGDTHTRVGILPGWGLTVNLAAAIGHRRAVEMSLTGNFMGAEEALRFGMVNHVVAHEDLIPTARRLAADIAGNNTEAVRTLLGSYRATHLMTGADAWRHEAEVGRAWMRRTYDPAAIEARRQGIMTRGRTQV